MPDIFVASTKAKKSAEIKDEKSPRVESSQNKEFKDRIISDKPYVPQNEKKVHLFSSFCINPEGIYFINQEKNEKILLFLRRSLITNFKWVVWTMVLLSLPLFALPFLNISQSIFFLPIKFIFYFVVFYYLLVFSYAYVNFITWYFNISLVTDTKIVDIDFSNLVYKNIAETKLSLIQDVSSVQIGTLRTLFDYGDILVQTAGTLDNFSFRAVSHPENSVHIIEDLIGKHARL